MTLLALAASSLAIAAPAAYKPDLTPGLCRAVAARPGLDQQHVVGEFRILYALSGPDALPDAADQNGNGVPDRIDDLAAQLTTARDFYNAALGLTPPLRQPRYRRAQAIRVTVRAMTGHNGLAFDEVIRSSPSACVIGIAVNRALTFDHNPTAAHELFHLYQYGYAMFKRGWYLEGMARWIEQAFLPVAAPLALVRDVAECRSVFGLSYGAATFWRALASRAAPVLAPPALRSRVYHSGGAILRDKPFTGASAVRPMLEALARRSDEIADRAGIARYGFAEREQTAARHDAMLCAAVEQAVASPAHR